jgi:hypothetical protein
MALSPIELGALLDRWVEADQANIVETQTAITISKLSVQRAVELHNATEPDWTLDFVDGAMEPIDIESLDSHMGPYIATIQKLAEIADGRLLTRVGFAQALESQNLDGIWQVACARYSFATGLASFNPWGRADVFSSANPTKSPRDLVREAAEKRVVPSDIRKWALRSKINEELWGDQAFQLFAKIAAGPLVRSLVSEAIGNRSVVFSGPPRLNLAIDDATLVTDLQQDGFSFVQSAVAWVYEDQSSAEQRHAIYAAEFARSISRSESIGEAFRSAGKDILEGARLVYQLSQSELSREAIKAQGDLRKTIADDMSKIADGTRSLTTAIAVAIATGIGLVATRSTSTGDPRVFSAIAGIVALYLLAVTLSGWQYLCLLRRLRVQWRQRLYRFIPSEDYNAMVSGPAAQAERPYHFMGIIGLSTAIALFWLAYGGWAAPITMVNQTQQQENSSGLMPHTPAQKIQTTPMPSPRDSARSDEDASFN